MRSRRWRRGGASSSRFCLCLVLPVGPHKNHREETPGSIDSWVNWVTSSPTVSPPLGPEVFVETGRCRL